MIVEPDAEVVQCHPRRQARAQTLKLMGTLPPQAEGVEQLVVDALHYLADRGHPPPQKRLEQLRLRELRWGGWMRCVLRNFGAT